MIIAVPLQQGSNEPSETAPSFSWIGIPAGTWRKNHEATPDGTIFDRLNLWQARGEWNS